MKKWSVVGVILALVIGTGAWFFLKDEPQKTMAKTPTVSVQQGKLEVNISGSGSVSSAASQDVSTDENQEVYDVDVSKNDQVDQGDTLLTFSDGTKLDAPIGGTLTKFSLEEGDRVTAGKTIAHITNYNDLQTTIQVDEMNISKVKTGQNATIKVSAFPDQSFTGEVTSVAREGNVSNGVSTFDDDNGMGIPDSDISKIFERFYQTDQSRTAETGTGLGLSIAEWIVDKHGGTIDVQSKLYEGTRFNIVLPKNQKR